MLYPNRNVPAPAQNAPIQGTHIDGMMKGRLSGNNIIIGSNADVDGDISAIAVIVQGVFRGQIEAKSVHLGRSCVVEGTIRYGTLTVEMGAHFEGGTCPLPHDDIAAEFAQA